jgi:hypothetical protein
MCNGWTYGAIIIAISLQVVAQFWEISRTTGLETLTITLAMRLKTPPNFGNQQNYLAANLNH